MASGNPASPSGATQGAWTQSGQDGPVQLVRLDEDGGLTLDEGALSRCLEQGGVGGAPVCLVSVIGEQRQGKSFLLNCLLRRLRSPEAADASWMSRENEALSGFQCGAGTVSVTKGVWMWGQPLWVQAQGRKVAVFLVDTEGCLDLQRHMETSIKLSVFSILLSSYWIFNISSAFKRTEADYLEMFIHVAKAVGKKCNLSSLQPLDLLVRDWQLSEANGANGGKVYLAEITQKQKASPQQPLVLEALSSKGTRCFLLPHPGTAFTRNGAGKPGDMDEDFCQCLCEYLTSMVQLAGNHVRMDGAGQVLTGAKLAARVKEFSRDLKAKHYDFSSPMKMAMSMAVMRLDAENSKVIETARRENEEFMQQVDLDHQDMKECLSVQPLEMEKCLKSRCEELVMRYQGQLQGDASQRQAAKDELQEELYRQVDMFLSVYKQRYEVAEAAMIREKKNEKVLNNALEEHSQFLKEKDRDHESIISCLRVKPAEMQRQLEEKYRELLDIYKEQLQYDDFEKQAILRVVEQMMVRQMELFQSAYEQRYKEKAVQLGQCIGGGTLAVLGMFVGTAIRAGWAVAASLFGGVVGIMLGAWVGKKLALKQSGTSSSQQGDEEQSRAGYSEKQPLLCGKDIRERKQHPDPVIP